jgi:hypothetical protein
LETSHQLTPATGVTPIPISPLVQTVLLLAALAGLVLLFWWSLIPLSLLLGGATLALILSFLGRGEDRLRGERRYRGS